MIFFTICVQVGSELSYYYPPNTPHFLVSPQGVQNLNLLIHMDWGHFQTCIFPRTDSSGNRSTRHSFVRRLYLPFKFNLIIFNLIFCFSRNLDICKKNSSRCLQQLDFPWRFA